MSLKPELKVGDRIVCYYMEDEVSNVPIGMTGTVTKVSKVPFGMGIQYDVNWDNGSKLAILPEVDSFDYEENNVLKESRNKLISYFSDEQPKEKTSIYVNESYLDDYFSRDDLYTHFPPSGWDVTTKYLEALRNTGIVNMFGASPYLYSPWEWIEDKAKWEDLDESQEESLEIMRKSHPEVQSLIIQTAMNILGEKDADFDIGKINSMVRKVAGWVMSDFYRSY